MFIIYLLYMNQIIHILVIFYEKNTIPAWLPTETARPASPGPSRRWLCWTPRYGPGRSRTVAHGRGRPPEREFMAGISGFHADLHMVDDIWWSFKGDFMVIFHGDEQWINGDYNGD